jgi:hypothetical protein
MPKETIDHNNHSTHVWRRIFDGVAWETITNIILHA